MKRENFFIFMILTSILSQAFPQELIEIICQKSEEYGKIIKQYVQIEEVKFFYMDENGNEKNEEIIVAERFWKNNKWMRRELKRIQNGKIESKISYKREN